MASSLIRTSEPEQEIISVQEGADFLREGGSAQEEVIGELITASREWLEAETARNFGISKYELHLDGWRHFTVPRSPLVKSSLKVFYTAPGGGSQEELDGGLYTVIDQEDPARVEFGSSLPALAETPYPVCVKFDAGYTAENAPNRARLIIKLLLAHYYSTRDIGTDRVDYSIPIPARILHLTRTLKLHHFL